LITGAGLGGGPHVKVYAISLTSDTSLDLVGQFYAYNPLYSGGVNVASGFITNNMDSAGNLFADILVGPAVNSAPLVEIFRLDNGQNPDPGFQFLFVQGASFLAYDIGFTGGVDVAVTPNLDGDANNTQDFITGAGPGGGPHIRVWAGQQLADLESYTPPELGFSKYAYDSTFKGGVFVA
jgi:hypothetical protein